MGGSDEQEPGRADKASAASEGGDQIKKPEDKLAETQDSLRRYKEQYHIVFEENPLALLTTNTEGIILSVNKVEAMKVGYTVEELSGRSIFEAIYEEDRDSFIVSFRQALNNYGQVSNWEVRKKRKDGSISWFKEHARPVKCEDGRTVIVIACEEITESRNYLAKIINLVADPIFVKDRRHRLVLLNDAFCNFIGLKREELMGRSDYGYLPKSEADIFWSTDEAFFTTREDNINEEMCTDAKAIVHTIVTKKTLYTDDKGEIFIVGIIRDITEGKKIEAELIKAQKLESVGLLAGGIAHDFNNILTAIMGNISLSKILLSPQDKAYERLIDAEMASVRAKDLARQLLTFSKGGSPVTKTISVAEVIQHSVRLALSGSSATCEVAIPDDLWSIEADEGQISQVIHNLIINADQAMPYGGQITVVGENIHLEDGDSLPLQSGKYVKIVIKDQGIGILKSDIGKIFDPYFSTKKTGKGLGLAAVYSILKNHGGHVTVESKVAAGSAFTIYLPASGNQVNACRQKEAEVIPGRGRILIMDDEEVIRQVAAEILKHIGYEVELAEDGTEAIEMYKKALESRRPFDAVIMDLTIAGGLGGKEAIKEITKIDPKVKAIVSSGYSNDPVMSNFREYGFSGAVMKPYRIGELSEQIGKVIKG